LKKIALDYCLCCFLTNNHSPIGRAYKDRSGLGAPQTKFTDGSTIQRRADGSETAFKKGGSSWTEQFLIFDNSYFQVLDDDDKSGGGDSDGQLLKMSTDRVLFNDPAFRPHAVRFRDSQEAFFASYAKAHSKLSELGSKFHPCSIYL